jgi:P27 family predicted phage terminase small subunit
MIKQDYLTDRGQQIFDEILAFLKDKGVSDNIDTFELSMLANEFDKYHMAAEQANKKGIDGYMNEFDNGTIQVNAYHTIMKDCYKTIMTHSAKFGLNPEARSKIFKGIKTKKKKVDEGID